MKFGTVALLAVVLCTGCQSFGGEGPQGADQEIDDDAVGVSGSRLKRRTLATRDGARQFVGWFDTDRGENCSFRKVEWNVDRCIPDETVIETSDVRAQVLQFSDPACEKPVAVLGHASIYDCSQGLVSKYLIDDQNISCKNVEFRIFQIGDRLGPDNSTDSVTVYSLDDGECVEAGSAAANECASLTEIPLDSFVEGGERIE